MSDFYTTWQLARQRFDDAVLDLNDEQLNWRIFPGALTAGEAALHLAGVEVSFCSQLLGIEVEGLHARLKVAATEGVVNELPFPFSADEITSELVAKALAEARGTAEPVISAASEEVRSKQIKSALGPMVSGDGALARLAQHPAYHQGQVYMVRQSPGFPK